MVKRTTALILVLLLLAPLSLLAAQVAAVADRNRLGAGESLQLELRVQGRPDGDPDLAPLEKDWEILSRSQSSQMQIINGDFNRSLVLSLTLMPRHPGELEIPALCFGGDCSVPLPIQVRKPAETTASGAATLLLEAEATPRQALVGSQLLLTVRLLHRVDLAQASLSEPQPQGVEAEIQQLGKDRRFETHRDGILYQGIERRYVLFPHQAGTLHLPALQLDAQVTAPPTRMDPFGRAVKPVRRFSQPLDIRVEPIPGDLGNREWLPANNLTLEDDWQTQPPTLRVGEPATRTLALHASGLSAGHLPELKLAIPPDWKSYPDQPSREDGSDQTGIFGTLQQKIALIPTRAGEVELPAINLDWYDVAARQWRVAHLDPVRVRVVPAAPGTLAPAQESPAQPVPQASAGNTAPAAQAPKAQPVPAITPPASAVGFWPWLSLLLALGWLVSLLLFWRQRRPTKAAAPSKPTGNQSGGLEKDALQAILTAAGKNDSRGTRDSLLAWSRCRWPAGPHDLEQLGKLCGEPVAGELAQLGAALYAPSPRPWQGKALAEALKAWLKQQQQAKPKDSLPPLYPGR